MKIVFKKPQNRRHFVSYAADVVGEGKNRRKGKKGKVKKQPKMIKGGPLPDYDMEVFFNEMVFEQESALTLEEIRTMTKVREVKVSKVLVNAMKFPLEI